MGCIKADKFLGETPLHGYSYIPGANKIALVFWSLLIIGCSGLALNDLLTIIAVYRDEEPTVDMKFERNTDRNLVTPTLCMEVLVPYSNQFNSTAVMGEIEAFLSATNNAEKLDFNDSAQLNITTEAATFTYLMLGYITEAELFYTNQTQELISSYVTKWNPPNQKTKVFLQEIYKYYMSKRVSLGNLKRLIAMYICQKQFSRFQYGRYTGDPEAVSFPLCKPKMITHMSFSLICTKIWESGVIPIVNSTLLTFSFDKTRGQNLKSPDGWIVLDQEPEINVYRTVKPLWHLDLEGRPTLPTDDLINILNLDPSSIQEFDFTIETEYEFYNRRKDPCSNESGRTCEYEKIAEQMLMSCKCWPSTLLHLNKTSESTPACSENHDRLLNDITNGSESFGRCGFERKGLISYDCLRSCKTVVYGISKQPVGHLITTLEKMSDTTGRVSFTFRTKSYRMSITQIYEKTWTTFISEFGGSIGTWLGGSIIAFLHIPVFVCAHLFQKISLRKKRSTSSGEKGDVTAPTISKTELYPSLAENQVSNDIDLKSLYVGQ